MKKLKWIHGSRLWINRVILVAKTATGLWSAKIEKDDVITETHFHKTQDDAEKTICRHLDEFHNDASLNDELQNR